MRFLSRLKRSKKGNDLKSGQVDILLSRVQFRELLERERERASRNGHAVALVLIDTDGLQMSALRLRLIAETLNSRIRQVDEVGWFDDRRIGIILPYTTKEGALHLAEDLSQRFQRRGVDPSIEVYTFFSEEFLRFQEGC